MFARNKWNVALKLPRAAILERARAGPASTCRAFLVHAAPLSPKHDQVRDAIAEIRLEFPPSPEPELDDPPAVGGDDKRNRSCNDKNNDGDPGDAEDADDVVDDTDGKDKVGQNTRSLGRLTWRSLSSDCAILVS